MKKAFLFACSLLLLIIFCHAQLGRKNATLLNKWSFIEDTVKNQDLMIPSVQSHWTSVIVPHVFRQSGLPDNTAGWYKTTFTPGLKEKNQRFILYLEGATTVKDVFVNGKYIAKHKSAYTASAFDLTSFLHYNQPNVIAVHVSNRDEDVRGAMARSSLYYNNGGMFRKAWLVKTDGAVYIYPESGSSGVFITPSKITKESASVSVRTVLYNPLTSAVTAEVRCTVYDPAGKQVALLNKRSLLSPNEKTTAQCDGVVQHPKMWSLHNGILYTVKTELYVNGILNDCVTEHTAFRTIRWENNRFLLNGKEVQLKGVNKHAQDEYSWNAMTDAKLLQEWNWILQMKPNMVRLAHYPHSHFEYNIADKNGIAIWAENGFAGHNWTKDFAEDQQPTADGERITQEMVRQNWNHPSILFWSAGNETVAETVDHYAGIIRNENDPTRLVTYASSGEKPKNCDFIAFNTYHGWYYGNYVDFKKGNELVSETGAGSWPSQHVPYGTVNWKVNVFEPEEYTEMFTEYRLQTINHNDPTGHPMFLWWNFREFYDLKFKMNRNTKGLVTLAGLPKDITFLFRAFFNETNPIVHLNGRFHFLRRYNADNGIKAYANVPELELFINGVSKGKKQNGEYKMPDFIYTQKNKNGEEVKKTIEGIKVNHVFFWNVPLAEGKNIVEVKDGKGHSDKMIVYQNSAGETMPVDNNDVIQHLTTSEQSSPAFFIARKIEEQAPFYMDTDGSSDNTFDLLPGEIKNAYWITTKRMSDEKNKTDISFTINKKMKEATVYVLYSTGSYPTVTLKKTNDTIANTAMSFAKELNTMGFSNTGEKVIWRNHDLERCDAALWKKTCKAGERITLKGKPTDYVILIKAKE